MELLVKVGAIAIVGVVLSLFFKKDYPAMSLMLTIILAIAALFLAFEIVGSITDYLKSLADKVQLSPAVLTVVFKVVGIAIITKLAADICKDAQQNSVASGVELTGSLTAVYVALPLFKTVISMIDSLV
jgi:stage III sporulation protein AD